MTGKKVLIVLGVVLVAAAVVAANLYYRRDTGLSVQAEALRNRDLEAIGDVLALTRRRHARCAVSNLRAAERRTRATSLA